MRPREYRVVRHWQRFCSPQCRDAWHYDQWKRAEVREAEADHARKQQVNGLREKFDAKEIMHAIKYGRPAAPVAENGNGMRRRAL
jgi:hypothetical protein